MSEYRPWGTLQWLTGCCDVGGWNLFGCLGTEHRCLSAWHILHGSSKLADYCLLRISNLPSRFDTRISLLEAERLAELRAEGGDDSRVENHRLLETYAEIVASIDAFMDRSPKSVVLDVSALPKRFFFPALRRLLNRSDVIKDLIVTYALPAKYTTEKLGENVDDWDHLPLFTGSYGAAKPEMMVIGVGFEAFRLQERVEQGDSSLPLKLLFPFPAPAPNLRRNWELVRRLQRHRSPTDFQIYYTDPHDIGDAFDRILSLTSGGVRRATLAPFGPKPMSVATCIFATLTDSEVYYTQPSVYHADYSSGVAKPEGSPAVYAYCIRLNGHDYYRLP